MSIISESYVIDSSEPGFIRIDYSSLRSTAAGPHQFEASLWFERSNAPWITDALRECIAVYAMPERSTSAGSDTLRIYESGPEQAPYVNLENERSKNAPHGGFQWFAMSKTLAQTLADELAAFV